MVLIGKNGHENKEKRMRVNNGNTIQFWDKTCRLVRCAVNIPEVKSLT